MDYKDLELKMAQMRLYEHNHLLNIYEEEKYRGWYQCEIDTSEDDTVFRNTFVRFRLPPTLPLYNNQIRNFNEDERLVGIHRMLIGKDLIEDTEKIKNFKNIQEFVNSLTEDEVNDFLTKLQNSITFDCNKIEYLLIIEKVVDKKNQKETIDKFIEKHPDYIDIFTKVLNNKISISEAEKLSNGIIFNEYIKPKI